ncbi:hypothetical protein D0Z07_5470 [Hyphodiscus hymeniophilus]|uniref:Alpha/beta hydrolase fold-3 domain-containing protein n=1 Tax=Hyphodiscus hymeniophilus TaxID=353542 RepID=A0A9P6VHW5_9HELO|nr:hypothetical protein D0Z07_5470 [Hyphodiscus hymeniophilus]
MAAEATEHSSKSSSYLKHKADLDDLTILEKLDVVPAVLTTLANAAAAIFTRPFRPGPDSYFRYVAHTATRTLTRRTSVRQQRYITAPTDVAYLVACKNRGVTPNSEMLEDGTTAHWIGSSKAEKLVLNFPGGGYVFPASPEMFEFMFQIVDTLQAKGKNAAVLFLSYGIFPSLYLTTSPLTKPDLAPRSVYPRQLQQAATLLNHVLHKLEVPPSKIILAGDSAGANLTMSLLSHISHPHPSGTIQPVSLSEPLRGVILISPWISFRTTDPSFQKNAYKDCIDVRALRQWSNAFIGEEYPYPTKSDSYNHPITAPISWWEGLKAEEVLVTVGEEEVLVDSISEFAGNLRSGAGKGTKVELSVAEGDITVSRIWTCSWVIRRKMRGNKLRRLRVGLVASSKRLRSMPHPNLWWQLS